MKNINTKEIHHSIFSIKRYIIFFLILCLVITCCILLFVNGIDIPLTNKKWNAISTFISVIIFSLVFTIIDGIYHKITIEKPLKSLLEASQKIIKGDFSARVEPLHGLQKRNEMDIIIQNFNNMAEELASIETLRTDFIANVSHELKTPISIIKNNADFMQSDKISDEERKEYAKIISDSSKNLSNLITNILRLNKLENQKIFLNSKKFNLSEQLIQCMLKFESIWEEKDIDIQVDIDENMMIYGDEELLDIVWNNLLSNAFKFTEAKGTVAIMAKKENENIVVSIKDAGCGISEKVGKHIFDKFYQGDTSHATKGNGLGLALVKRIIEIMNYEISVESVVNKGTVFTVKINNDHHEI